MAAKLKGGLVIGKWKLGKLLGEGGQGEVWEVRLTTGAPGPPRAMKVCLAPEGRSRERFVSEVQLLAQLGRNQYVVPVLDSEVAWTFEPKTGLSYAFYVTERFDHALDKLRWLQRAPFFALQLFRDLCDAVEFLHVREPILVHRDIKPSNIYLGSEPYRLVLGDLGIAYADVTGPRLTETHEVVGSQFYRAPETMMGGRGDVRSDIYSLGRTLEWLLTGHTPDLPNPREIPPSSGFSPALRAVLGTIIATACSPDPAARHQTVAQLKSALTAVQVDIAAPPSVTAKRVEQLTFATAADAYSETKAMLSRRDTIGWRELEKGRRARVREEMLAWRAGLERNVPRTIQDGEVALDAILTSLGPSIASVLACTEHPQLALGDPLQLLREILDVVGWQQGGWTLLAEAPSSIGFAVHHLIGATAAAVGNDELVGDVAELRIGTTGSPLLEDGALVAWPGLLDSKAHLGWLYLKRLPTALPWLTAIFGDEFDYLIALLAYRWQLSFLEFGKWARASGEVVQFMNVPPVTLQEDGSNLQRAFTLAFPNVKRFRGMCARAQVTEERARERWPQWLEQLRRVARGSLPDAWMRVERATLPQLPT